MILSYGRGKIMEQVRCLWFVVGYLLVFQVAVLRVPLVNATALAVGLGLTVVGLALFLEGIVLGLMPLGELTGLRLPRRANLPVMLTLAFLLGFGATLAEPAIAVLRVAGSTITAADAPLLYRLLNEHTELLVSAIGIGVGLAVALGMLRSRFGWSLKPSIIVIVSFLAMATAWAALDPQMAPVIGLAWDSGGVTTGPVTVPLILALGIAVARASGHGDRPTSGFGLVTLASVLPVLTVFGLALLVRFQVIPETKGMAAPEGRPTAAAFGENRAGAPEASVRESGLAPSQAQIGASQGPAAGMGLLARSLGRHGAMAARAILPLSAGLLLAIVLLLRARPRRWDEIALGIVFSLAGMTVLGVGIEVGLAQLGHEVGRRLPVSFRPVELEVDQRRIPRFSPEAVQQALAPDGTVREFFYLAEQGQFRPLPYEPDRFDAASGTYLHTPRRDPLFGTRFTGLGVALVFLFAFGMGYGATLAEPALNALGRTVEEITAGTFRRTGLVHAVSVGVGVGMVFGVARIIWDLPLHWLLLPPYLALLPLTLAAHEEHVALAWDCAGVTTGPVTVPLVLALGLGVGGELAISSGFGILALASVYPILTVLLTATAIRYRQQLTMRIAGKAHDNA
jgi:hypothetical protein